MMNQKILFKYIILALLGLNIVVLYFLLFSPQPHRPTTSPHHLRSDIVDILGLDDQQATYFHSSADKHQRDIEETNEAQEKLLLLYFGSLINDSEEVDKDLLLEQLKVLEGSKLEKTYEHFQELKNMLNKDQLDEFELFISTISHKISTNNKKIRPRPKGFR